MGKKKAGDALGGMIRVKVTLFIVDARSLAVKYIYKGGCHLPKKGVVEVGQQFNFPLLKDLNDKHYDKLKAIITEVPQRSRADGIAMVATIYSDAQHKMLLVTNKHQLADAVTVSDLLTGEILRRFEFGNPDFKQTGKTAV